MITVHRDHSIALKLASRMAWAKRENVTSSAKVFNERIPDVRVATTSYETGAAGYKVVDADTQAILGEYLAKPTEGGWYIEERQYAE